MNSDIINWLSDTELEKIFSARYWNLENEEKKKQWYVLDGDIRNLNDFCNKEGGYFDEYKSIFDFTKNMGLDIHGVGIDLAAGTGWATALLSRIEAVKQIYALDISKHRLFKIAPIVFNHFEANQNKITRVIGNFLDIKLPNNSVDFCFMSSAFHHADNPYKLLSEIYRVLKPGGLVITMGEKPILLHALIKKFIKNIIKIVAPFAFDKKAVYKLFPRFAELYPPDPEDGEHYYCINDYFKIFERNRFYLLENKQRSFINFIAIKQ